MRSIFSFLFLFIAICSFGQNDSTQTDSNSSGLRISILTCGVGEELYSSFGHSGVRVKDSSRNLDEVYNYGTFNFSDPDFYTKFVLGKLLYYVEKSSYDNFMYTYIVEKRNVKEQVLHLSEEQKKAFVTYLEHNLLPENKYYKYDFLFDNCATRIRDIFPAVLGEEFYFGDILKSKTISYRGIINQYLEQKHWERFGINLLLGSKIDSVMTDDGSMFLPEFVYMGLIHARYRGAHVVASDNIVLDHKIVVSRVFNGPMWTMIGLLLLTVLAFHFKAFAYLKPIIRFVVLFVTGLLGILILFMWMGTNHQNCADNYNILWAIPFNAIVAFVAGKKLFLLKIYALAAISLLIVALVVHVIGIQRLPLIELSPLLLCMMYIYVDLYKRNLMVPATTLNSQEPEQQEKI